MQSHPYTEHSKGWEEIGCDILSYIWFTLCYGRVPLSQCVAYFSTLLLLSIGCLIGYFRPNVHKLIQVKFVNCDN
jgi:hypothetical protein